MVRKSIPYLVFVVILSFIFSHELSFLYEYGEKAFGNVFRLKNVVVRGGENATAEIVFLRSGLKSKPWVWKVSLEEVRNRLREEPWIEEVYLTLSYFPVKLEIDVEEAIPWFVAKVHQQSWLVSREGSLIVPTSQIQTVTKRNEMNALPLVLLPTYEESIDTEIFRSTVTFLKSYEHAGGFPFLVKRYEVRGDGSMVVYPAEGEPFPEVVLNLFDVNDSKNEFRSLSMVLGDLRSRKEVAKRIDLRFQEQVVVEPISED